MKLGGYKEEQNYKSERATMMESFFDNISYCEMGLIWFIEDQQGYFDHIQIL